MIRLLVVLVVGSFGLGACVEIKQNARVEVTAGTVPPEIRDARWPETPIAYCITRDDEGGFVDHETFVALTQRAIAAWGVQTTYDGECSGPVTADNGVNEIGWGTLGTTGSALNEAGNANIRYRTSALGGAPDIIETDITIERKPASGRSSEDCLYTTLLHETGHLFGVPHLDQSTVMSPVITDCLQELTPGDLDAINKLY